MKHGIILECFFVKEVTNRLEKLLNFRPYVYAEEAIIKKGKAIPSDRHTGVTRAIDKHSIWFESVMNSCYGSPKVESRNVLKNVDAINEVEGPIRFMGEAGGESRAINIIAGMLLLNG
jgi:hypothetical protein